MAELNVKEAIEMVASERNIKPEKIFQAIRKGIIQTYEKKFNSDTIIHVDFTGEGIDIFRVFRVVNEVTNPNEEISIADVQAKNQNLKIDDEYHEPILSKEFNRLAINMASMIIKQQIRSAEKEAIMEEYLPSKGEIMYGEVVQSEPRFLIVRINQTLARIPSVKLIRNEQYFVGDPITFLAQDVVNDHDAQIQGSRTDDAFLAKLMEQEIPEVMEELITIKAIARNPGFRSKVIIQSKLGNIDPIGTCIGRRGLRINTISQQLNNEKIDLALWTSDLKGLILGVLNPAKVIMILITNKISRIDNQAKSDTPPSTTTPCAYVVVPNEHYFLAVGFKGRTRKLISRVIQAPIYIINYHEAQQVGLKIE